MLYHLELKVRAGHEALVLHPEGQMLDDLVEETLRQIETEFSSHWKLVRFPVKKVQVDLTLWGVTSSFRVRKASSMSELIFEVKKGVEKKLTI